MRVNETLFRQWLDDIFNGSPTDELLDAHDDLAEAVCGLLTGQRVALLDDAGQLNAVAYQNGDDIVIDENVGPETD